MGDVYQVSAKHLGQDPFDGREVLDIYLKIIQSAPSTADTDARPEAIYQLQKQGLTDAKEIHYDAERIVIPLNRPVGSPSTNGSDILILPHNLGQERLRQLDRRPIH